MSIQTSFSAVYGGAFDPPHFGHLAAIRHLVALPGVDRVWVIPSVAHAFGKSMASLPSRMAMLRLLLSELSMEARAKVVLEDVESELKAQSLHEGPVYSLHVLDFLAAKFHRSSFKLALGPDNCIPSVFNRFHGASDILERHGVVEIPAQSFERSTFCRRLFRENADVSFLQPHLPASVIQYAQGYSLYSQESS